MIVSFLATAALLAAPALAQEYFDGPCPTPTFPQNFDLGGAFSTGGVWYEHSKYKSDFLEGQGVCVTWEFTAARGSWERSKITTNLIEGNIDRQSKYMTSEIWPRDSTGNPDYNYKVIHQKDNIWVPGTYRYQIIAYDTADDAYAVAWSCKEEWFNRHTELVWILTRARAPTSAKVAAAREAARTAGVNIINDRLKYTVQTTCLA